MAVSLLDYYALVFAYLKTTAELAGNGTAFVGTVSVLSLCDTLAKSILDKCSGNVVTFLKLAVTLASVGL